MSTWPLPLRRTLPDGSMRRSFASVPASTLVLTAAQRAAAEAAARDAYAHGLYGNATRNWQHAEIACAGYLLGTGLSADVANELGGRLAGEVVREMETATPAQPF